MESSTNHHELLEAATQRVHLASYRAGPKIPEVKIEGTDSSLVLKFIQLPQAEKAVPLIFDSQMDRTLPFWVDYCKLRRHIKTCLSTDSTHECAYWLIRQNLDPLDHRLKKQQGVDENQRKHPQQYHNYKTTQIPLFLIHDHRDVQCAERIPARYQ